ncbi:MAG: vitamin B12 transporter [Candidatus Azotimanducaceae bacterium]
MSPETGLVTVLIHNAAGGCRLSFMSLYNPLPYLKNYVTRVECGDNMSSKNLSNLICIMLTGLISSQVLAEEIETITVTASRTPIETIRTGSSVSIIDEAQIKRSLATNITELLRSIPGLQVNQQGSKGAVTQIRVRGAEANHLLVLVDGVEVNDIAQGGEFNFAHLSTDQIKRIEVVRGPQSALWGSDALAGIINIITMENKQSDSEVSVVAETGSFNSQKLGVSYNKGSEKTQFQASLNHFATDGTNISRQGDEEDGYKNTSLTLNGNWHASDNLAINAMIRHIDTTSEYDAIDFFTTGLPVDADNKTESIHFYSRLSADLNSFDGKYNQRFSFARTDTDNENDTGGVQNDISRGIKDQYQYTGTFLANKQTLTLIAEYEDEKYQQRGVDAGFGNPNRNLNVDNKSIAFEYRFDDAKWHLSASYRFDNNSDFDDVATYRLTANWLTPVDDLFIYSSIGRASKNPSFTERFGFFDTFVGNANLEPEQSDAWEIGVKFSRGSLNSSISYFNSELENEINGFVFIPDTFSFTADNRAEKSERQGSELEISWLANDNLSLNVAYTYLESTFGDANGEQLSEVRRPRHIASIMGNYSWQKANFNLSVNYNGRQSDDFFPPFPASPARVSLSSYTLVNFATTYQVTDKLNLHAKIENAFDDEYEEVFGYQSPGFAAFAGLRYRW